MVAARNARLETSGTTRPVSVHQQQEKGRPSRTALSVLGYFKCLEIPANTDGEVTAHHVFALGDAAKDRPRVSGRSDGIWGDGGEGILHVEIGRHGRAIVEGDLPGEGEVHGAEAGIIGLGKVGLAGSE